MYSLAPKRKERDITADRVVHAVVRLAVLVLDTLPAGAARALGRFVAWGAWRFGKRWRRRVLENMDIAFRNEKTKAEKEDLCRRYFDHLGLAAVEFARMTRLTPE